MYNTQVRTEEQVREKTQIDIARKNEQSPHNNNNNDINYLKLKKKKKNTKNELQIWTNIKTMINAHQKNIQ